MGKSKVSLLAIILYQVSVSMWFFYTFLRCHIQWSWAKQLSESELDCNVFVENVSATEIGKALRGFLVERLHVYQKRGIGLPWFLWSNEFKLSSSS